MEQQRGRTTAESHPCPLPRLGPTPPASSSTASCSSGPRRAANNSPQQAPAAQREARGPLTEGPLFTCRPIRRVPPHPCQVGVEMLFKCHPLNVKSAGDENGRNHLQAGVPPRRTPLREGLGETLWARLDRQTDRRESSQTKRCFLS